MGEAIARLDGMKVDASARQENTRVLLAFNQPVILGAGRTLEVELAQ
ncbi:MAG: hypothetical protein ACQESR_13440 [Planctomycetota bacterium]